MIMPRKRKLDVPLLTATFLLLFIGLVMVYSSSSNMAEERFGSHLHFLKRQAGSLLLGLLALWSISRLHTKHLEKVAAPLMGFSIILLVLVLIRGIGVEGKGAMRWIEFFGFTFQPAEIAKLALVLFGARLLSRHGDKVRDSLTGYLPIALVGALVVALLLNQPDFGAAATVVALVGIMLFVAGTRLSYLAYGLLGTLPVLGALIAFSAYRRKRIFTFLDPWDSASDSGYQIIQSFLAFAMGGWHGVGLGGGRQKLLYLPEPHTDFIFSVVGEELGLIGVVVIVVLYGVLLWRASRIAINASDHFGAFLALGVTSLFGLQAIMNMGVVMGMLPTKGLTLPLISYGGSSLVMSLAGIGILLAVGAQSPVPRR
jgi:cell division protein FtsW